jgi:hypothetical protein
MLKICPIQFLKFFVFPTPIQKRVVYVKITNLHMPYKAPLEIFGMSVIANPFWMGLGDTDIK